MKITKDDIKQFKTALKIVNSFQAKVEKNVEAIYKKIAKITGWDVNFGEVCAYDPEDLLAMLNYGVLDCNVDLGVQSMTLGGFLDVKIPKLGIVDVAEQLPVSWLWEDFEPLVRTTFELSQIEKQNRQSEDEKAQEETLKKIAAALAKLTPEEKKLLKL